VSVSEKQVLDRILDKEAIMKIFEEEMAAKKK